MIARAVKRGCLCFALISALFASPAGALQGDVSGRFRISVVDDATGRGVPLVELRTTAEVRYFTDSAGNAAFDDAALMNRTVFFTVSSHGYQYPKDSFGYEGLKLEIKPGGSATIRIKKAANVADRLYRITGEGIYRDTLMLGLPAPTLQPGLNGQVSGQDSVMAAPFHGRLWWFYGDTARPAYPLGNFHTSGATSLLPGVGGLNPETGINLNYVTDGDGFARGMFKTSQAGPIWIGGLCTVKARNGTDSLICTYSRMKNLGTAVERGIAVFDEQAAEFKPAVQLSIEVPRAPAGHPVKTGWHGLSMVNTASHDMTPIPIVRFPANLDKITGQQSYEAFTPIAAGTQYSGSKTKLDRNLDGSLTYSWKPATDELDFARQQELVKLGLLKPEEGLYNLRDVETGKAIRPATGSVFWNAFRHRWVMTVQEIGGSSLLGEVWYAEADTITGPWVYGRKIISHQNYSFYNPTQHPVLDASGGKRIFLEGTYTRTFTQNQDPTPRYEYNQMMYGLSLDSPALYLPSPVYTLRTGKRNIYVCRERLNVYGESGEFKSADIADIPFLAMPPGRQTQGTMGFVQDKLTGKLQITAENALFYALPSSHAPSGAEAPVYEYRNRATGEAKYAMSDPSGSGGWERSSTPIFVAWKAPTQGPRLQDWDTLPVRAGTSQQ